MRGRYTAIKTTISLRYTYSECISKFKLCCLSVLVWIWLHDSNAHGLCCSDCTVNASYLFSRVFFVVAFIKNNCIFYWAYHRLAPPLSCSSSLGQHKPCIPRRDQLCLPLPTGTARRQTEGPLLFPLWFLAASARFLHVYHCNQQARPAVSQAAWNKAARMAVHKVGEALLLEYWEEGSVLSLSALSVSALCHQRTVLLRDRPKCGMPHFLLRRGTWSGITY